MEKQLVDGNIGEIKAGDAPSFLALVQSASKQEAKNGPFWRLELQDKTGSIEARIWSPESKQYADIPAGSIVRCEGRAESFREKTQINVRHLHILSEEESKNVDWTLLVPASERPSEAMLADIEALVDKHISHKPLHDFAQMIFTDPSWQARFLTAPGAKSVHHAKRGGFLEHTLSVAQLCMRFCDHYPHLDRQVLLIGAIVHDLGKLWELSDSLSFDYTTQGRLMGHISLALEKITPLLDKAKVEEALALHIKHLILSHHGLREYGSPVLPQTAEAFALHYADNLDAKLVQIQELFTKESAQKQETMAQEEGLWTPYQRLLERPLYRSPMTPSNSENVQHFAEKVTDTSAKTSEKNLTDNPFETSQNLASEGLFDDIPHADFADTDMPDFFEGSETDTPPWLLDEEAELSPWPLDDKDSDLPPWPIDDDLVFGNTAAEIQADEPKESVKKTAKKSAKKPPPAKNLQEKLDTEAESTGNKTEVEKTEDAKTKGEQCSLL